MLKFYDVQLGLRDDASISDLVKLKSHFKSLNIEAVGIEASDLTPHTIDLSFAIYGNLGPFMMKKVLQECTSHIFPGSVLELSQRD